MKSGTAFSVGQMAELNTSVSGAVTIALPKVAAKFGDPKAVLAGIKDKTEVLVGRLEIAIEKVIQSMIVLIRRPQRSVTISERRDHDIYYRTRSGIHVWDDFRMRIVAKARLVEAGTTFKVNEDELGADLTDEQIESGLPKDHLFDASTVGAIIAEMIESGQLNKKCFYLLYTASCVVQVFWYPDDSEWVFDAYDRGVHTRDVGRRVLSPTN